jgi:diguanylate cyclase (GGDEF)-like protein
MAYSKQRLAWEICKWTGAAIALSLSITLIVCWLTQTPITSMAIILPIVSPLIGAPMVTFFTVRTRLQLEAAQRELERLSSTDELTGLYNRRFFLEHALQQLSTPQPIESCLLLLDLDHFKHINDSYGHEAGDAALRHCALVFEQSVRTIDLLARFGGEEFVVLLPHTPLEQAGAIAERIRARIEKTPLELYGQEIKLSVSIGCGSNRHASDLADLLRQADRALYRAKNSGRNRVEVTHAQPQFKIV